MIQKWFDFYNHCKREEFKCNINNKFCSCECTFCKELFLFSWTLFDRELAVNLAPHYGVICPIATTNGSINLLSKIIAEWVNKYDTKIIKIGVLNPSDLKNANFLKQEILEIWNEYHKDVMGEFTSRKL